MDRLLLESSDDVWYEDAEEVQHSSFECQNSDDSMKENLPNKQRQEVWRAVVVQRIACVLEKRILERAHLPLPTDPNLLSLFHSASITKLSISQYLDRLVQYADPSAESFVLAVAYMDRLANCHPSYLLSPYNVHRMLLASVVVASKCFDDLHYCNNARFAQIGGVTVREMNYLEAGLLHALQFATFVSEDEFRACHQTLANEMEHSPACDCGLEEPIDFDPMSPYTLPEEEDEELDEDQRMLLQSMEECDLEDATTTSPVQSRHHVEHAAMHSRSCAAPSNQRMRPQASRMMETSVQ